MARETKPARAIHRQERLAERLRRFERERLEDELENRLRRLAREQAEHELDEYLRRISHTDRVDQLSKVA